MPRDALARDVISGRVEYALYALAVTRPDLFASAERHVGGMLANDVDALARVRKLLADSG